MSLLRTGSVSSSSWLWTFAEVPWPLPERLNGFEFDEVVHLFRNKCVIKISRPRMIAMCHRDNGGEIQSKNLLVQRGIFFKTVLQASKDYGASFRGFVCFFRLQYKVGILLLDPLPTTALQ